MRLWGTNLTIEVTKANKMLESEELESNDNFFKQSCFTLSPTLFVAYLSVGQQGRHFTYGYLLQAKFG